MTRNSWSLLRIMAALTIPILVVNPAPAQTPRTLDLGGPPGDAASRGCATDSMVTAALAAFNSAAAVHLSGGRASIGTAQTITGNLALFRGALRIDGSVGGNLLMVNGDVRVGATGVVKGRITIIGGHLTVDPGAQVSGTPFVCDQPAAVTLSAEGMMQRTEPGPSLGSIRSALTLNAGPWQFTPHLGIAGYNRVEGGAGEIGVNASRRVGTSDGLQGELFAIVRSARDPSGSRPSVGWHGAINYVHNTGIPFVVGFSGGSTLQATHDQPFSVAESGVSAFVLRRDYNDWFLDRSGAFSVGIQPTSELRLFGSYAVSRQTTVLAVDAFSLLRNTETWRPNPLIDDGKYHIATGRVTWDATDERKHPVLSWLINAQLRRVSSDDLTPVSTIPTAMRDALPITGYGATDGDLDIRAYLRLGPEKRMTFRLVGGGYVSGNPLTIQDRRAIGGADPLLGYDFRAINCDHRRKADPATPALCDRSLAFQTEYHRTIPIDVGTRIGSYNVGIRNPEIVVLADIGSAWLAGDSAGRVPTGKIQALREWKSDVGVGVTAGPVGLYLVKALADALPVRLTLLLTKRF